MTNPKTASLPRRIALYARATKTEEVIDLQFQDLRHALDSEHASFKAQKPEFTIAGEYGELSAASVALDRPELTRLLKDIKAGMVDHVMVTRLDRLSRNAWDLCKLLSVFEAHGVTFASLTEQIDTATTVGKAMVKAMRIFDETDSLSRSERIKHGKEARKAKAAAM